MNFFTTILRWLVSEAPTKDAPRLTKQCRTMYKRLCEGRASNVELMNLTHSMNWTARMSEIRKCLKHYGQTVTLVKKDHGGVNWYEIQDFKN